jgi:DNA repair protein RecO (recombination protein O)
MSRTHNFTGIILRKRPFMEKDLIITILTKSGHRHDLIAKGANGKSRRKNHLELMNLVKGTFYEGKTNAYLQDIQCQKSHSNLKENLETCLRMHLILEIIEKTILEEDPHPEIFELLQNTLASSNQENPHPLTPEIALTQLAHHLGFLPNFKECSSCHEEITEDNAGWDPTHNTLHCPECLATHHRSFPLKYRKAIEFFRTAHRSDHQKIAIQDDEHKVLQDFIPNLFTRHLSKPLKSLSLIL